ncbi:MAG: putative Ig domain-containing protein, partial [Cyanobacteria bacterium J06555_13]
LDGTQDGTGSYQFMLRDRSQSPILELDTLLTGRLESSDTAVLYQFTGEKGTVLDFNLTDEDLRNVGWSIYDPSDRQLKTLSQFNDDRSVTLPSAGQYTLLLNRISNNPVDYSFEVTDATPSPVASAGLNTVVTATLTDSNDVSAHSFSASAGTLVFLDQLSTTTGNIRARLKNPDGTFAFVSHSSISDLGAILLTQTGEYTLETFSLFGAVGTWEYQLLELISDAINPNFNPQPFSQVQDSRLATDTATDLYQIEAIVGQELLFNGMEGDVNVTLIDPNGNTVFTEANFRTRNFQIPTLMQDGIYSLLINGNGGGDLDYAFQLINLAAGPEIEANLPIRDILASGLESKAYQFEGKANQKLFFDILSGDNQAQISVYSANLQEKLVTASLGSFNGFELTLPDDGFYAVLVEGSISPDPINYEFQIFVQESDFTSIVTPGTGEDAGNERSAQNLFPVTISADDGRGGEAIQDYRIRLLPDPDNAAPTIISTPELKASLADDVYRYQVRGLDPDEDVLGYRLVEGPVGALIDQMTGQLQWFMNGRAIAGETYAFTVEVYDRRGGIDTQTFEVEVFENLGTVKGLVFDDLNQNGILDLNLIEGNNPDVFFVLEYSCGLFAGDFVDWTTADLDTVFNLPLSPVTQELGAVALLNEYLIEQGFGDSSNIGIIDGQGRVFDMDLSTPGLQVTTNPLADNNNNGIIDVREALKLPVSYGSNPSAILDARDLHGGLGLTGDLNIFYMSSGNFTLRPDVVDQIDAAKTNGVNISAFSFSARAMDKMRIIDPDVTLLTSPQQVFDIFSGNALGENFEPSFFAEPLLENVTVYLDINNNGVLDVGEPTQITQRPDLSLSSSLTEKDYFAFDDLLPGEYTVRQVVPDGFFETTPATGSFVDVISTGSEVFTHQFGIAQVSNPVLNQNPIFQSTAPSGTLQIGQKLVYQAQASDADLDPLTYELALAPEGMTVDPSTGTLVWQPTAEQVNTTSGALLRAQDGKGGIATQFFELEVVAANSAPVFTSVVPVGRSQAGKPFEYQAKAVDADGDALTFALSEAPANVSIDSSTGLLSWTPAVDQLGQQTIRILVSDGNGGEATQTFRLSVAEASPNQAPLITSFPRTTAQLERPYAYQPTVQDPDGDPISIQLVTAPTGMSLDEQNRLVWQPTAGQLGEAAVE